MPVESTPALHRICQLKIMILGVKPPIWRRVLVPDDLTLAQLHNVVQAALGWEDAHLHEFRIGGRIYSAPDPDAPGAGLNEKRARLSDVLGKVGAKAAYIYDFGDDWEHSIVVEKMLTPDPGVPYPVCMAGKRQGPPEDCGGAFGYESFLEAIRDPQHGEHKSMREWIGGDFDPETFSVEDVNRRMALLHRRLAKRSRS